MRQSERERIAASMIPQVQSLARAMAHGNQALMEVGEQAGIASLAELIGRYDPTKGAAFETYSFRALRLAIGKAIVREQETQEALCRGFRHPVCLEGYGDPEEEVLPHLELRECAEDFWRRVEGLCPSDRVVVRAYVERWPRPKLLAALDELGVAMSAEYARTRVYEVVQNLRKAVERDRQNPDLAPPPTLEAN